MHQSSSSRRMSSSCSPTSSSSRSSRSSSSSSGSRLLILSSLLAVTLVMVGIGPAMGQDNPVRYVKADELRDHSGKCFDASRCSLRDVGDEWTVHSDCERALCQVAANGTLMEKRTRCREPSPILSEDCYILRVEGRPFPHCCPKLFCNDKPVTPDLVK